ncbi:hypothetical protein TWF694_002994 [Orbilia ellipsospora]|uniref:Heterokaryon incompatibility domain-containing protein n=1 Tax=Orbilia ellipsospora TaxID=2528407 RepID=A0AAV9X2M1_9PEZI
MLSFYFGRSKKQPKTVNVYIKKSRDKDRIEKEKPERTERDEPERSKRKRTERYEWRKHERPKEQKPKQPRQEESQRTEEPKLLKREKYEQKEPTKPDQKNSLQELQPEQEKSVQQKLEQEKPVQQEIEQKEPVQQELERKEPEQKEPEQKEPEQKEHEQKEPEQKEHEQKEPEQREPEQKEPEQRKPEQREPEQIALEQAPQRVLGPDEIILLGQDYTQSKEEAREHIEKIRKNIGRLEDVVEIMDIDAMIKGLGESQYSDTGHFIFELFQNADDCSYGSRTPVVNIRYCHPYFLFEANELGLRKRDVTSLCTASKSSKIQEETKTGDAIGEKGIGFKSVFGVSKTVWIKSSYYSFHFRKDMAFGRVLPHWGEFPEGMEGVRLDGHTSILLKIEDEERPKVLSTLKLLNARMLLFLHNLKKIKIRVGKLSSNQTWNDWFTATEGSSDIQRVILQADTISRDPTTLHPVSISIEDGIVCQPVIENENAFRYPVRMSDLPEEQMRKRDSEIIIVLPENPETARTRDVYAFLPIRSYDFKICIQADFILVSNRGDIRDIKYNRALVREVSRALLGAVRCVVENKTSFSGMIARSSETISGSTDILADRLFIEDNSQLWFTGHFLDDKLKYGWPLLLPLNKVSEGPFIYLSDNIRKDFGHHEILKDVNGRLRRPGDLTSIPALYMDSRGEPFLPLDYPNLNFISMKYPKNTLSSLHWLGVKILSANEFLLQLEYFMSKEPSFFHKKKSRWRDELCGTLLSLVGSHKTIIQKLEIVPTRNGQWVSFSGTLTPFFAPEGTIIPFPEGVENLIEIDPRIKTRELKHQENLFRKLGALTYSINDLAERIEKHHKSVGKLSSPTLLSVFGNVENAISHMQFYYIAKQQISNESVADLWCVTETETIQKISDVHIRSTLPYTATAISVQLLPQIDFLHPQYMETLFRDERALQWFQRRLGLRETLKIVIRTSGVYGQLEVEPHPNLTTLAENHGMVLLEILRYHWNTYSGLFLGVDTPFRTRENLKKILREMNIGCHGGGTAKLKDTHLPRKQLLELSDLQNLHLCERLPDTCSVCLIIKRSKIAKPVQGVLPSYKFLDVDEPSNIDWDFLRIFDVSIAPDLKTWLSYLRALEGKSVSVSVVRMVYAKISEYINDRQVEIQSFFKEGKPCYIPPQRGEDNGAWHATEFCIWDMETPLKHVPKLKAYYPDQEDFFRKILKDQREFEIFGREAMLLDPKDGIQHIISVLEAIARSIRFWDLNYIKPHIDNFRMCKMFPVVPKSAEISESSKEPDSTGPVDFILMGCEGSPSWYIPDSGDLFEAFNGAVYICMLDARYMNEHLIGLGDALDLKSRFMSNCVKDTLINAVNDCKHQQLTKFVRERAFYIAALISNKYDRNRVFNRLNTARVLLCDRVEVSWKLFLPPELVTSKANEVEIATKLGSWATIFVNKRNENIKDLIPLLCGSFAESFNIQENRSFRVLFQIFSHEIPMVKRIIRKHIGKHTFANLESEYKDILDKESEGKGGSPSPQSIPNAKDNVPEQSPPDAKPSEQKTPDKELPKGGGKEQDATGGKSKLEAPGKEFKQDASKKEPKQEESMKEPKQEESRGEPKQEDTRKEPKQEGSKEEFKQEDSRKEPKHEESRKKPKEEVSRRKPKQEASGSQNLEAESNRKKQKAEKARRTKTEININSFGEEHQFSDSDENQSSKSDDSGDDESWESSESKASESNKSPSSGSNKSQSQRKNESRSSGSSSGSDGSQSSERDEISDSETSVATSNPAVLSKNPSPQTKTEYRPTIAPSVIPEFQSNKYKTSDKPAHPRQGTKKSRPSSNHASVLKDLDYAKVFGELHVSQFLESFLGDNVYKPNTHWTSNIRSQHSHTTYHGPESASTFTIKELDGELRKVIIQAGGVDAAMLESPCEFHIQVIATDDGDVYLTDQEFQKARNMTVSKHERVSQIYILACVSNIRGDPIVDFYLDPWKLYTEKRISLRTKDKYRVRVSQNTQPLIPRTMVKSHLAPPVGSFYEKKSITLNHIRLLRLDLTSSGRVFKGEFEIINLSSSTEFWAISYCWGRRPDPNNCSYFETKEGRIPIGDSLASCLRYLREEKVSTLIWADAVCINQKNNMEKAQQVKRMGTLYSRAKRVIVWVGDERKEDSRALKILNRLQPAPTSEEVCVDDDDVRQIENFLSRDWFTRMWIIQELVLSDNVTVKCGSSELQWNAVIQGIRTCEKIRRETQQGQLTDASFSIKGSHRAYALDRVRALRIAKKRYQFIKLRNMFFPNKSSRPPDKLFSLVHLAFDTIRGQDDFNPDYDSPDEIVLYNFMKWMAKFTAIPKLLYWAGDSKSAKHCSWMPDFMSQKGPDYYPFPESISEWPARSMRHRFNAGGNLKSQRWKYSISLKPLPTLKINGILFDTIREFSTIQPAPEVANIHQIVGKFKEYMSKLASYPGYGEEWEGEVLLRSLVGDAPGPLTTSTIPYDDDPMQSSGWDYEFASEVIPGVRLVFDNNTPISNPSPRLSQFWSTAVTFMRKFPRPTICLTEKGYLGVVPEVQVGDRICILRGARVPFIIRQHGQQYKLIGEAFIHGLMYYAESGAELDTSTEEQVELV